MDLNDTGNRVIAGIGLALVFLGGWWLIARNAIPLDESSLAKEDTRATGTMKQSDTNTDTNTVGVVSDDTPTIAASDESIDVKDQSAGMSVSVAKAVLAQMGWIAVRDEDGRTLGAGRFEAGEYTNVDVPLLRATESGKRYQALIYVDDGDKEFDLRTDILVMLSAGSVAGDAFAAQ